MNEYLITSFSVTNIYCDKSYLFLSDTYVCMYVCVRTYIVYVQELKKIDSTNFDLKLITLQKNYDVFCKQYFQGV